MITTTVNKNTSINILEKKFANKRALTLININFYILIKTIKLNT